MNPIPLGTMPLSLFLSEYWQKTPLLIRNALPNITSPVHADVLAGLACEEDVESRIVIRNETANEWELKHGPFSEEIFTTLPATNWTLLIQAVDHWIPEAANFLELFTFIPRWRIDDLMISYASNGGGVGPHYDNYDVFLVQTDGKRKWEVGKQYNENSQLIKGLPLSILNDFKAIDSWVLEPGDILYVPPGYGHNGIAVGDDCITYSVGFRTPSHSEILREYTDHMGDKISDAIRYNDADLVEQSNAGEINEKTLDKIQNILRQYIEDKDSISDWFGRYITIPKYFQENNLPQDIPTNSYSFEKLKNHLITGGRLIRNESSRFAYITKGSNHILFVDGECVNNINDANPLIETLCVEIELNSEMFPQSDNNLNLILSLLQRGALYIPQK